MDKNKQLPSLEVSQVNNAIFLHLNRQVPPINGTIINNYWREGETKHIGNKINPAWETAMNYFPKELKKVQLLELCMEEVRNKYFPHKPSRKTGLFVFGKDKKQIEYWIKKLTIFPQLREPKLILLKLTGKIHKGNFVSAIDEIGLNNYYESSCIEPTVEFGKQFLDRTEYWAGTFKVPSH